MAAVARKLSRNDCDELQTMKKFLISSHKMWDSHQTLWIPANDLNAHLFPTVCKGTKTVKSSILGLVVLAHLTELVHLHSNAHQTFNSRVCAILAEASCSLQKDQHLPHLTKCSRGYKRALGIKHQSLDGHTLNKNQGHLYSVQAQSLLTLPSHPQSAPFIIPILKSSPHNTYWRRSNLITVQVRET